MVIHGIVLCVEVLSFCSSLMTEEGRLLKARNFKTLHKRTVQCRYLNKSLLKSLKKELRSSFSCVSKIVKYSLLNSFRGKNVDDGTFVSFLKIKIL